MPEIVVAGHVCLDIIPRIIPGSEASASFLAPGRITEAGEAILSGGGAVSNTGLALRRLGADVALVGRMGDDLLGSITRQILGAEDPGLTRYLTIATGEPGSYTIVLAPPGIDRTFLTGLGPNDTFGPEDIASDLLAQTRIFHLGYPPLLRRLYGDRGTTLAEIMRRARAQGATTSLDMAMPDPNRDSGQADWRAILARSLPHIDIFVPSVEELLFMLRRERFEALCHGAQSRSIIDDLRVEDVVDLAETALDMGTRIVMIKLGHRGVYLRTRDLPTTMGRGSPAAPATWRDRELWSPAFQVSVAGTVGAGDATVASFLLAILRAQSPEAAVSSATAAGAASCEAADAVSGLGSWSALQARLSRPWPRLDPHLDSADWSEASVTGLRRSARDGGSASG